MRTDRQIRGADGAAPQSYEVSNTEELVPLAVTATFDGSGAAGAFVPTLVVISDGGVVISRSPVSTPVAAGGSAEVSFFPGAVSEAAAAPPSSGGGVAWGYIQSPTITTIGPESGSIEWDWNTATFIEDGSGVVSVDKTSPTPLIVTPPGGALFAGKAWLTVQAAFISTGPPANIAPSDLGGYIVPQWPDVLSAPVINGVFSVFVNDDRPVFGAYLVRYSITSTYQWEPGGEQAGPYGIDLVNRNATHSADVRFAWLGVYVVWSL